MCSENLRRPSISVGEKGRVFAFILPEDFIGMASTDTQTHLHRTKWTEALKILFWISRFSRKTHAPVSHYVFVINSNGIFLQQYRMPRIWQHTNTIQNNNARAKGASVFNRINYEFVHSSFYYCVIILNLNIYCIWILVESNIEFAHGKSMLSIMIQCHSRSKENAAMRNPLMMLMKN